MEIKNIFGETRLYTSWIRSGLVNNAAPIPPLTENDFGQPMFISTAATSLHLKEKGQKVYKILLRQAHMLHWDGYRPISHTWVFCPNWVRRSDWGMRWNRYTTGSARKSRYQTTILCMNPNKDKATFSKQVVCLNLILSKKRDLRVDSITANL